MQRPAIAEQQFPRGALYMVATPIGNLADITLRALSCLEIVDAVAAEDTRMARRLLDHFGIDKPCFAAHQHNEAQAAATVVARLAQGERIAYLSDAGTPAISDPGARLAAAAHAAHLRVVPIPGVSALTCALSVAGLPEGPVYFAGFLPAKRGEARTIVASLTNLAAHLVFYEAPHRILDTVALLAETLGAARHIVIARELTKLFESVQRLPLAEAHTWLSEDANRQRGEFVLIVEAGAPREPDAQEAQRVLVRLLEVLSLRQAVDLCADITGTPRKAVYARALALKKEQDPI